MDKMTGRYAVLVLLSSKMTQQLTQPLKKSLQSQDIHIEARYWDKPSDHVPVMVDLKIAA